MRFSERIGRTSAKVDIQIESMDDDLRVGLWNCFQEFALGNYKTTFASQSLLMPLFRQLWRDFFKLPMDTIPDFFQP